MLTESLLRNGVHIEELSTGIVFKILSATKFMVTLKMLETGKKIYVARTDFDMSNFKAVDVRSNVHED